MTTRTIILLIPPLYALCGISAPAQVKSVAVPRPCIVSISLSGGSIVVVPWDKGMLQAGITGDGDGECAPNIHVVGATIAIDGGGCGDDNLTVSLPINSSLRLGTSAGDISIQGPITGDVMCETSAGDISIAAVRGDVHLATSGGNLSTGVVDGSCELRTSGGDVVVKSISGRLRITSAGGLIRIGTMAQGGVLESSGGEVRIDTVRGTARITTAGGTIDAGTVSGQIDLSTGGGDIFLHNGAGTIKVSTSGGNIAVAAFQGSLTATTAGGDIRVGFRPGHPAPGRIVSAGGDITLMIPSGCAATIDATIRVRGRWWNQGDQFSISSGFPQNTTRDDNAREIRSTIRPGGGGDLIVVETVNGNIEVVAPKQ